MKFFGYDLKRLRGDSFGGLTAGIVALPLALAFGVASGAGAAAGLYGAIALGLFAAIFGGTPTQISGPTGPMTIVAASAVIAFPGNPQCVVAVFLIAGLLQVILGAAKMGTFVRFIPYPVVSGFMNGIGVIIILLQLHPLLGHPSVSSPLSAVLSLGEAVRHFQWQAFALGGLTMAIVFMVPARISRVVPSPLIALVAGTALAWGQHWDVATIGAIPSSLPRLSMPGLEVSQLGRIFGLGLALAALGCIDSLLTSVVADSLTRKKHNSNRELVGQGIGNMAAALLGGLPGAGATMRTVVNIKAGGTTRVSGVIHAALLLSILMGIGPLASHIPMAVLAGILVKVGVDIIDYRLLSLASRAPRADFLVMVVVFGVTVFVDLIVAVGVGVTLAAVMVAVRTARQCSVSITEVEANSVDQRAEEAIQLETEYRIQVVTIRGPFFFGTTANMQDKFAAMLGTKVVVVNCLDVPFMDISAVFALGEIVEKLQAAGIRVLLAVRSDQRESLEKLGMGKYIARKDYYDSHESVLAAARKLLRQALSAPASIQAGAVS
ncbi:SulP family inorganic anion transporter [Pseudodesulfovibrio sp.]|uniref:SulP family inorganic anion transporter n=1 Tax=Pseudodesulfovibrio sp. TaxID=2035812 RepID=UPI00261C741D|nr:SulP family inorganic anion transporter [Pseudodesulfovibrio sp.]MDD3313238.1 SulP family inorganic anion transporter [Pseudodesulfovibrio sp.]